MSGPQTMTYEVGDRIRVHSTGPSAAMASPALIAELAACVEHANLILTSTSSQLSGPGKGFCGGYDLVASAEPTCPPSSATDSAELVSSTPPCSRQSRSRATWDPTVDYAMMRRNVHGFMSLFRSHKPVVCKVHGFCVAGGTDMALCSDLLVIEENAKIRLSARPRLGFPTTAIWAFRLGSRKPSASSSPATASAEPRRLPGARHRVGADRALDKRSEALLARIAQMPLNQLQMMKLLVNQEVMSRGLDTTQILGTVFDGLARHTPEGYAFQQRAAEAGFREAVRERDDPFGDHGASSFKG